MLNICRGTGLAFARALNACAKYLQIFIRLASLGGGPQAHVHMEAVLNICRESLGNIMIGVVACCCCYFSYY